MKIYRSILVLTAGFILLLSHDAFSQFYFGAGIGNAFINKKITDINGDDFKIDKNSFAYRIYGGLGGRFIGAEGGYRDLGKVQSDDNGIPLETKINGWDISAKGNINIGPVFVMAKAGAFFSKYENYIGQAGYTETETNFLWSLGAGVRIAMLGLRVEYESLVMSSDSKLAMLTLGASIHLGRRKRR